MTPAARVAAAIEILESAEARGFAYDHALDSWSRTHRFAGSGDRRAIGDLVFAVVRHRVSLSWRIGTATRDLPITPRTLVMAALSAGIGPIQGAPASLFGCGRHAPPSLDDLEKAFVSTATALDSGGPETPASVRADLSPWLYEEMAARFGSDLDVALTAFSDRAPVDLRVNRLLTDRDAAQASLAAEGTNSVPCNLSGVGLRVVGRFHAQSSDTYRRGWVEIQDQGSQLAAALVDARPGMVVVDFCAGGGGKTLALAAAMANEGRLIACDVDPGRLRRLAPRLSRSGVTIVERRPPDASGRFRVDDLELAADRVLVDAPCSGTGTLRRNPAARWRYGAADIADFAARQDGLLSAAARLVRPGGELVYVTCSLARGENEDRIEMFLRRHGDFSCVEIGDTWKRVLGDEPPVGTRSGPGLMLTPHRHGTDGFFVAAMSRRE
jgi:16S rRNA (cytosine967-C5)-methyltransferase